MGRLRCLNASQESFLRSILEPNHCSAELCQTKHLVGQYFWGFRLRANYGMVLNSWLFRAWERIPMGGLCCLNASQESFWRSILEPNHCSAELCQTEHLVGQYFWEFRLRANYGMVLNSWLFRAWEHICCLNASREYFWRSILEPKQTDNVRLNFAEQPNISPGNTFEGLEWGPTTVWFWILDFSGRESAFQWADFVVSMHLGGLFGDPDPLHKSCLKIHSNRSHSIHSYVPLPSN